MLSACALSSTGGQAGKVNQPVTAATDAQQPSPEEAPLPAASDFTLALHILKKTCFGSAGCNLTYRIDVHYNGSTTPPPCTVTYEVLGGEDGPQINSFTITADGGANVDSEETISTKSASVVLRARATEVIAS